MVKGFLSALILVISLNLSARTSPYFIDHETFVHLSNDEKDEVLLTFKKFMVELDSAYEKEPAPTIVKAEKLRQMLLVMSQFQNLVLASANAEEADDPITDPDPFKPYREKFEKTIIAINTPPVNPKTKKTLPFKENICIYGGWISTTVTIKGKSICQHPANSSLSSYYTGVGKTKQKIPPGQIACNPLIFGFKNPKTKTLFTAVANSSAINSSLDCMKQSGEGSDAEKALRLKSMRDAYASPQFKDQYNATAKFIHQSCLCNDGSNHMDKSYLSRIQPHRTCFALLNQYRILRENKCAINLPGLALNTDLMQGLERKVKAMETSLLPFLEIRPEDQMNPATQNDLKELDASFANLLGDEAHQKEYCAAQNVATMSCKFESCSSKDNKISCQVEVLQTKSPKKVHTIVLDKDGSATIKKMMPVQGITAEDVVCKLPLPACEVGECKDGKCAVKISNGTSKESSITFGDEKSKTIQVTPEGLKGEIPVVCEAPPKEAICVVSKCVDGSDGAKTCDFTVTGGEVKDKQASFVTKEKEIEILLAGDKKVICAVIPEGAKSTCSLTFAENDDKKNLDITITLSMVDKDIPKTPALDPASLIALTTDDKKLVYKAQIAIPDKTKVTAFKVTNFSTTSPNETCSGNFPEKAEDKPKDDGATLALNGKRQGNQIFNVFATVTIDGKTYNAKEPLPSGYYVVWYEKDRPELSPEEKKKRKDDDEKSKKPDKKSESIKVAQDSDAKPAEKDKKENKDDKEEAPKVEGQVQSGALLSYATPIITTKYEICADLMKGGKVIDTKCQKVPSYTPPPPQQPGFIPPKDAYRFFRAP